MSRYGVVSITRRTHTFNPRFLQMRTCRLPSGALCCVQTACAVAQHTAPAIAPRFCRADVSAFRRILRYRIRRPLEGRLGEVQSVRCSGGVAFRSASAWAALMQFAAIASSRQM